ncbi:hypothetical protein VTJ83DRAFT_3756 [Remersonia thermophila]|uniref:Beta-xylanase n=1 Tax=Remersonia thermophila TaxID=72144 RepID=A0ABR4DEY0_9PEZI
MAKFRRTLLVATAVAAVASAQQQQQPPEDTTQQPEGLHALMLSAGKLYFGTATDVGNHNDEKYQAILAHQGEFGIITPENSQKWEVTEPRRNQFVYTTADTVAEKAQDNGHLLRCHTLTWHSQLPPFVSSGSWNASDLTDILTTHITNVMTHFKGRCYAWDVVNEALEEDGTYRESVFYEVLGDKYIPLSFKIAAQADPEAKLYYNDFNLETSPKKADGAERIVKLVRDAGERIDGVGFQGHLIVGQTPSRRALAALLSRFARLGVEVAWTELDIAHDFSSAASNGSSAANATQLEQQAADYVSVVGACLDEPRCVGVTVWQFTDKYSWVPLAFPGRGEPCLWTATYTKKPAYDAVSKLLREAAANKTGVSTSSAPTLPTPSSISGAAAALSRGGSGGALLSPLLGVVGGLMAMFVL